MKQVERKKTAHLHVDMDEELYSKLMQKAESYGVGLLFSCSYNLHYAYV